MPGPTSPPGWRSGTATGVSFLVGRETPGRGAPIPDSVRGCAINTAMSDRILILGFGSEVTQPIACRCSGWIYTNR